MEGWQSGRMHLTVNQAVSALVRIQLPPPNQNDHIRHNELMTSKEVKHFYENQDKYVSKKKKLNHFV